MSVRPPYRRVRKMATMSVVKKFFGPRAPADAPPDERIRYRLFVPRDIGKRERCPLFVWMHGFGEGGDDNIRNLQWFGHILRDLAHVEKYRFFLLTVQCPSKHRQWHRGHRTSSSGEEPDDMLAINARIVRKLMEERPIDKNRVFLSGVSGGGSVCWVMAARYPDLFSAVVPMASYVHNFADADKLADMPVWAFNNTYDYIYSPETAQRMVEAVNAAGGNAHITLVPEKKHTCFIPAFQDHNVLDWMLAQRRGAWVCWTPPGCRTWSWWHILTVPFGFAAVAWLGLHLRRRRLDKLAE